uniref:spermine oxidase-like n=1 Tax=Styela clava TaxID=7725 RepID=UPI00193973C4|nr:spermine oxidase-like [Styela clava]XP_039255564.1 spermine oxidase-like [Styela clava]
MYRKTDAIYKFLLLLTLSLSQTCNCKKVVIIGAGVSGLSAARVLFENGQSDVTILEATDRIGGRIFTTEFKGHMYEHGAQWIHGAEGNAVYEYLHKDTKLEIESWGRYSPAKDSKFQYYSGRPLTPAITDLFWNSSRVVDYIELEIERLVESVGRSEEKVANLPLGNLARKMWRKKLFRHYKKKLGLNREVINPVLINKFGLLEITDGGHPNIVNCLAWYQYEEYGDNDVKVLDGYMSLPKKLSKSIPKSAIKLNSKVKSIQWNKENKNGVAIKYLNQFNKTEVIHADMVLVTVSIGCLKKYHKTLFDPNLPKEKHAAIKKIGFGAINKMFLFYEEPFWGPEKFSERYLIWDSYDELTDTVSEDEFSIKSHWCRGVYKITSYKTNFLMLWITKKTSNRIRNIPESDLKLTVTNLLRRFLNNPKLPGPDDIITTKWHQDKNFLGTYSYPAIGQMSSHQKKVREPLYVNKMPRVFFAGEALSIPRYSTVDGAFSTGKNEGERILKLMQESNPKPLT